MQKWNKIERNQKQHYYFKIKWQNKIAWVGKKTDLKKKYNTLAKKTAVIEIQKQKHKELLQRGAFQTGRGNVRDNLT